MTSVGSNFLCGRPHGAYTLPVRMRPSEPEPLLLRVDVINGWPRNTTDTSVSVRAPKEDV